MSDAAVSGQRGTTISFRLAVNLNGADFDVTPSDTLVVFTAKRRRSDDDPLIQITYNSNGGSDPGISLVGGSTNLIQLDIPPDATADYTATEFLVWDAVLTEPTERETVIAKGSLTVRLGVGT